MKDLKIEFTPGPWKYDPDDRYDLQIKDKDRSLIAEVADNRKFTLQQCQGNARLIAAAPDLAANAIMAIGLLELAGDEYSLKIAELLKSGLEKAF